MDSTVCAPVRTDSKEVTSMSMAEKEALPSRRNCSSDCSPLDWMRLPMIMWLLGLPARAWQVAKPRPRLAPVIRMIHVA